MQHSHIHTYVCKRVLCCFYCTYAPHGEHFKVCRHLSGAYVCMAFHVHMCAYDCIRSSCSCLCTFERKFEHSRQHWGSLLLACTNLINLLSFWICLPCVCTSVGVYLYMHVEKSWRCCCKQPSSGNRCWLYHFGKFSRSAIGPRNFGATYRLAVRHFHWCNGVVASSVPQFRCLCCDFCRYFWLHFL